ncbi:MAG: hypothetical protein H6816_13905 [Phycisphaerales bacterium]|nr:hypothetical protein [Phycisphaerales bacterium]
MNAVRTCSARVGCAIAALIAGAVATERVRADAVGPDVVLWYGTAQTFGQPGVAQTWANVLGNVSDPDGVSALTYTLNGGPQQNLRRGPDTRRLLMPGDFNVEIDFADLQIGDNDLVITATDNLANVSVTPVTVTYAPSIIWPLPYGLDLSGASALNEVAQVVDGDWVIATNGVRCPQMGYDRVLAVGDIDWAEYEVTATITMLDLDPAGYNWPSVSPGFGMTLRWRGHTDDPVVCPAPHCGWLPAGGTVWYDAGHDGPLSLDADLGLYVSQNRTLDYGVPYVFKMRVEDAGLSGTFYAGKVWRASDPEPVAWDLSGYEPPGDVPSGSAIFVAHHMDIRIADVTVVPLGVPVPPVISDVVIAPAAESAVVTWTTDKSATSRVEYGLTAGYGDATSNGTLVTNHSVLLSGLAEGTLYHCRISSTDNDGLTASTNDLTFTTITDCNANGIDDGVEISAGSAADCNGSGVPDACELAGNDCNTNGVPDECDPDCNSNATPDDCESFSDCNGSGVPDECELAGNDCNTNGVPDECDTDCNANGTPDDCEAFTDCNASGVPDECELAGNDCDSNGVPDECDVDCNANGTPDTCEAFTDCNGSGVPDECELAGNDCNTNGVPDECDTDCNANGTPDDCEAFTDCNGSGVPDECELAGNDCDSNGVPDECDTDCNTNSIPDACESFTDCNTDGVPDECELSANDCDANGVPDECDVDCNANGTPDACEAFTDCNASGVPDECELAGNDCDSNGVPDECDTDCNTNGIPDACESFTDCNTDGIPDECQLAANDCDTNGVPDECDIDCNANGTPDACESFADCNASGVPDECELAGNDCDSNGVPDECDTDCNANGTPDACEAFTDCNNSGVPDECELVGNDCNSNGVPDECDSDCNANGTPDACETFADCNASGVPDECELAGNDCDSNGVPDECDTDCNANGTPDACETFVDCNASGVPDECELAGNDCNSNGVPDECDTDCDANGTPDDCEIHSDCNSNGIPDVCDVLAATSADVNGDLVPDECQVHNLTQGTVHATIAAAIAQAAAGDELRAPPAPFRDETVIDFDDRAITLRSTAEIDRTTGSAMLLADGALLASAPGSFVRVAGALDVPALADASLATDAFELSSNGYWTSAVSSEFAVNSENSAILGGTLEIQPLATVVFSNGAIIGGSTFLYGGVLSADSLTVTGAGARLYGYGNIVGNTLNSATVVIIADTQLVGDLVNEGTITIQNGTFTLTGSLAGGGAIIGDMSAPLALPRSQTSALFVAGDFAADEGARLVFPSSAWTLRLGGDFDVAVTTATDIDLARAQVRFVGLGPEQTLEALSVDLGPTADGLNPSTPGHYPLGTLQIGPQPATVRVVDNHPNSPGSVATEAIYVDTLRILAGATLLTDGHNVYYRVLELDGSVDDPSRLIRVVGTLGDCDLDGDVDAADGAELTACLAGPLATPPLQSPGGCPCAAVFDADADGDVDLADFAAVQVLINAP